MSLPFCEWGTAEYGRLIAGLLDPQSHLECSTKVFDRFGHLFSDFPVLPVNRGRTALRIALEAFRQEQPDRSQVVVPAYVCPAVLEAVRDAGLSPWPIDIGSDLNLDPTLLNDAISPATLAVVAPHTYGCPAQIAEISQICRARSVFLIDDAAAVMGVSLQGRCLGSFGDAGIFSFSQSKGVVVGGANAGALLVMANPWLEGKMRSIWRLLPPPPRPRHDILLFMWRYPLSRFTRIPTYYWRRLGISTPGAHEPSKLSRLSAEIAVTQLDSLSARVAARKRIVQYYHDNQSMSEIEFPQYCPGQYLSRVLFALPEGVNCHDVRSRLQLSGIPSRLGYPLWQEDSNQAPKAHAMAHRLIELGCHARMSERKVALAWAALAGATRDSHCGRDRTVATRTQLAT
jgi:dTDP-4-amino-4,6-dideoxygalactose transaminase